MKFLLVAVNAKYIHSNLGVYSIKAYADKVLNGSRICQIEIGEYTINQQPDDILQDIYRRKPDVIGFSCYIWNIQYVKQLVRDIPKILPGMGIWLGGPEVSYNAKEILEQEPSVTGVMVGEGEAAFAELADWYQEKSEEEKLCVGTRELSEVRGLVFREPSGRIVETLPRPLLDLDEIPFSYGNLEGLEHRIIYYESSRGCPYSCSYCLSSIDKKVRFRSLELVKKELDFFIEHKVPQVKFVDRTFNCKKSHALAVWKYLLEHDNGITNFHFEISADLIDEEELAVMKQMRPGLIQLEIGVQTTNPQTIAEIRRKMDLGRLKEVVDTINGYGNIHQHLDLIAGLPFEGFHRFRQSFDDVYRMRPDQLQLGFLKVLTGSYMAEMAENYGLSFHEEPPYEVLSTNWLNYGEVLRLKGVEDMVEVYYNSGQFSETLKEMEKHWDSPYAMFEALAEYYEKHKITGISHSRLARYEILFDFLKEREPERTEIYRDLLIYDLYLRENVKSRPSFARDPGPWKLRIREFFQKEEKHPEYLMGYEGYDSRQMGKMAHLEVMGDGTMVLFDYKNRNPLSYNAKAAVIKGDV